MGSTKDECVLYLKERKGVIRLALEKGFSITATFAFGQRNTYSFWLPSGGIFAWIGRKIGFVPMLFFGWLGIPFNIPKPVRKYVNRGGVILVVVCLELWL